MVGMCVLSVGKYSTPHTQCAVDPVEELRYERLANQDKIIDLQLQNEIIGKKDFELESVQKSVSTELQYYSSALQKRCSAVLAPRKIISVIRKTVRGKDPRKKNLTVFGLLEERTDETIFKMTTVFDQVNEKLGIILCSRL